MSSYNNTVDKDIICLDLYTNPNVLQNTLERKILYFHCEGNFLEYFLRKITEMLYQYYKKYIYNYIHNIVFLLLVCSKIGLYVLLLLVFLDDNNQNIIYFKHWTYSSFFQYI